MTFEASVDDNVKMDMKALRNAVTRRWLRILLVTVLLLGATFALLQFVPKTYEANASILVENRDSAYTRPTTEGNGGGPPESADSMISSQIELVKSRDTLLTVVRQLNLTAVPEFNGTKKSAFSFLDKFLHKSSSATPEDIAVDVLSDHLTVARTRDSALIVVTVRSGDPELAAKLANAVAQADVARRAGLALSDTADSAQWLDQQITQMRQKVADAENKVANFKVDNDLFPGATATGGSTSLLDQQMTEIATQITASQERGNTAQSRSTLIRGLLAAGQPIDGIDDVRNSVTIQQLEQQRAQLLTQRAQLLATLLPTHPTVQAVTAQISVIDRQIITEGRRVADALDAEVKVESNVQKSLQANLDAIKAKVGDATKQTVTLDALDREAKADRDLLESYLQRYGDAASRTDANSSLPDVRVVTLAAPPTAPSSPKTTFILGAVGFVSIVLQLGAIVFGELLSGRALTTDERLPGLRPLGTASVLSPVSPTIGEPASSRVAATEVDEVPEPVAAEAPVGPVRSHRGESGALRTWFSRRARAEEALADPEPASEAPSAMEMTVGQPVADEETNEPQAELAPVRAAVAEMLAQPEPPRADTRSRAAGVDAEKLANLSADLVLGRARVVLLSALDEHRDTEQLAARLTAEVLRRGVSVALVDAGSGSPSSEPGVTDLAAEVVGFGDVVHKRPEEGLAEVPWGHQLTLDPRSLRPLTLVQALSDIYEVVLVLTGRLGENSSLPIFAALQARLVLVTPEIPDDEVADAALAELAELGYPPAEILAAPPRPAQVA